MIEDAEGREESLGHSMDLHFFGLLYVSRTKREIPF